MFLVWLFFFEKLLFRKLNSMSLLRTLSVQVINLRTTIPEAKFSSVHPPTDWRTESGDLGGTMRNRFRFRWPSPSRAEAFYTSHFSTERSRRHTMGIFCSCSEWDNFSVARVLYCKYYHTRLILSRYTSPSQLMICLKLYYIGQ